MGGESDDNDDDDDDQPTPTRRSSTATRGKNGPPSRAAPTTRRGVATAAKGKGSKTITISQEKTLSNPAPTTATTTPTTNPIISIPHPHLHNLHHHHPHHQISSATTTPDKIVSNIPTFNLIHGGQFQQQHNHLHQLQQTSKAMAAGFTSPLMFSNNHPSLASSLFSANNSTTSVGSTSGIGAGVAGLKGLSLSTTPQANALLPTVPISALPNNHHHNNNSTTNNHLSHHHNLHSASRLKLGVGGLNTETPMLTAGSATGTTILSHLTTRGAQGHQQGSLFPPITPADQIMIGGPTSPIELKFPYPAHALAHSKDPLTTPTMTTLNRNNNNHNHHINTISTSLTRNSGIPRDGQASSSTIPTEPGTMLSTLLKANSGTLHATNNNNNNNNNSSLSNNNNNNNIYAAAGLSSLALNININVPSLLNQPGSALMLQAPPNNTLNQRLLGLATPHHIPSTQPNLATSSLLPRNGTPTGATGRITPTGAGTGLGGQGKATTPIEQLTNSLTNHHYQPSSASSASAKFPHMFSGRSGSNSAIFSPSSASSSTTTTTTTTTTPKPSTQQQQQQPSLKTTPNMSIFKQKSVVSEPTTPGGSIFDLSFSFAGANNKNSNNNSIATSSSSPSSALALLTNNPMTDSTPVSSKTPSSAMAPTTSRQGSTSAGRTPKSSRSVLEIDEENDEMFLHNLAVLNSDSNSSHLDSGLSSGSAIDFTTANALANLSLHSNLSKTPKTATVGLSLGVKLGGGMEKGIGPATAVREEEGM
jgi:hypothetical protein